MTQDPGDSLTPAEWKIMKILWRRKSCSARDVYTEAGTLYGWAMSTSKTLLRRLVEKGHVKASRLDNSFLYQPARPALGSLLQAADTLLRNAVEGMAGALLVHLVKNSDLSAKDVPEAASPASKPRTIETAE